MRPRPNRHSVRALAALASGAAATTAAAAAAPVVVPPPEFNRGGTVVVQWRPSAWTTSDPGRHYQVSAREMSTSTSLPGSPSRGGPRPSCPLPDGPDGPRTVSAELMDDSRQWGPPGGAAVGNTSPRVQATITLDRAAPAAPVTPSAATAAPGAVVAFAAAPGDAVPGVDPGTARWRSATAPRPTARPPPVRTPRRASRTARSPSGTGPATPRPPRSR